MSGGVDSSVAAFLMKDYKVVACGGGARFYRHRFCIKQCVRQIQADAASKILEKK